MQFTETAIDEIDAILKGAMTYGAENCVDSRHAYNASSTSLRAVWVWAAAAAISAWEMEFASFRSRLSPSRSSSTETSNSSRV